MPPTHVRPDPDAGLTPEALRAEMERVLASETFPASRRRRDLLRYVVEETLAGRADRLKGFSIGVAVFGRDAAFDPQTDPVVRLEARRLRRDLESYYEAAGETSDIRITVPKGAYLPHFERREAAAGTPPASPAQEVSARPEAPAPAPAGPPARLRLAFAALAFCAMLGVLAGIWGALRPDGVSQAGGSAQGPAIMVLPFTALGVDAQDRFLAAGMAQDLIAELMRFPDFRLFSTLASFQQSPEADPVALGRSLDVSYVVQGGVRSDAAELHVQVLLTDAKTGEVLWSGDYDRPLTPGNIYEVQAAISTEIATTLGQPYGVVSGQETRRLARGDAPSLSSYACVLRAYDYRRGFHTDLYGPVRACLEAATARDPDYADAWAMLGWLHLDAGRFGFAPEGRARAYALALETATRGVAADPQSTLALKALASVYHYLGRYDESERLMRAALDLNPNDPDAMAQYGWRLSVRGKFDEGVPYLQRAIDRTISPPGWYFHLIAVHDYLQGDFEGMLAAAERSGVDGSAMSRSFVAIAQGALGHEQAARQALDELAAASPGFLRDPAAAYRVHHPTGEIVDALLAGLRQAGWTPPPADSATH
jgi:TolB-like protein